MGNRKNGELVSGILVLGFELCVLYEFRAAFQIYTSYPYILMQYIFKRQIILDTSFADVFERVLERALHVVLRLVYKTEVK